MNSVVPGPGGPPELAAPTAAPERVGAETLGRSRAASGERARDQLGRAIERLLPAELHLHLLGWLLAVTVVLRLFWLSWPDGALIFDERYYVNAARVILGIPPGQDVYQDRSPGLDPNTEHPPLAKLLVAASMGLLGDQPYGWRLPSIFFGTAAILLMYGIAARVSGDVYLGLLAAALLAFDNLVFVHSRMFTLDVFQLALMLLGVYWYLHDRPALAGAGFALAALCKIGGAFGLFVMAGYEGLRLLRGDGPWRQAARGALRRLAWMGVAFAAVFLLLLGLMDRLWVGYSQPLEHVQRIVTYGMALRRPSGPEGVESYPWQWLRNEVQIPYLRVDLQVKVGDDVRESQPVAVFLGAMNPWVLYLLPFGLGFAAWAWWRRWPEAELGALALAWFAGTYVPLVLVTVLGQRIAYLFYFLPTLPAVALAGGGFLMRAGLPRIFLWAYLVAVLLGFGGYFPFKPLP